MSDGVVILGTVAIVGLVAVVTVALVYDRKLGFTGSRNEIQIDAGEKANHIGRDETEIDASREKSRVD